MNAIRVCGGAACGAAILLLTGSVAPAAGGDKPPAVEPAVASKVAALLERSDKNGDGSLERAEAPEQMARRFDTIDLDKDGKLSRQELERAARGGRRRPGAPGGGPATQPARRGNRPGDKPGEVITPAAHSERRPDTLKAGDPAPDFTLPDTTGKNEITLSGFRGKRPVVLIFASYT